MSKKAPILLIPVENQVRELEPKLLLACIAAQRGFSSYIGSRREMHFHIPSFPRGIYLSKSMTAASDMVFRIMRKLGHEIVAWDEEALVHLPPEVYYSRRLSPAAMAHVSCSLAWGEDNVELWRQYSGLPPQAWIEATGNPRNDMLRPELHAYYHEDVEKLWKQYGRFILVNTNFNHVNAFSAVQNLFQPVKNPGEEPEVGRAAKGMSREYAEGLRDLKQAVFGDFQQMVPKLEKAFPNYTIVVRPHPTESQQVYHDLAAHCERVKVTNEGNVVPWLLATQALIHNGCTTGAEAYVMRVPAVTYRVSVDKRYDLGFYRLPNLVSHPCFSFEELEVTLKKIFSNELGPADSEEKKQKIVARYLAALDGPLACERIVDVLEKMAARWSEASKPGLGDRLSAWALSTGRTLMKRYKDSRPGSYNRPEFQKHRYPPIAIEDIQSRIWRMQKVLQLGKDLKVEPVLDKFFHISA
jgi:surface carbohydrate biosynthesis protein